MIIRIKNYLFKHKLYICLLIILLLGAYFRFHGLYRQGGIINGDDESFLGVARSLKRSIIFLKDLIFNDFNLAALRSQAKEFFSGSFRDFTSARPGYILLITLPTFIFGVKDYIPTFLNAFLSLISVYIVYLAAKEASGKNLAGLIAALILAISGYSIYYSRTGLAQSTSSFFLIAGILFYFYSLRPRPNSKFYLKLAALVFGFLFTTHYNIFIFLGIIFIFEFIYSFRKKLIKERLLTALLYFIPFAVLFQLITLLKVEIFHYWNFQAKYYSYFGEIIYSFKSIPDFYQGYIQNAAFLRYLTFLQVYDSYIIVGLFILAIPLFVIKKWWRNYRYLFLFVVTFIPFIFYSFIKLKIEYNFVIFLPLIAMLCGFSADELINLIKNFYWKRALTFVLILIIIFFGLQTGFIFSSFKNPYNKAAQFLKTQGEISSICGTRNGSENVKFYLDDYSINSRMSKEECKNAQYVILDWALAYFPIYRGEWAEFVSKNKPVASFDHPYYFYMCKKLKWEDSVNKCYEDSSLRVYKNY